MLASLHLLFSVLCGQYADHTFVPGGLWLPCCQRCTGLYGGAAMAALLHLWLRPRLTARWLALHGLCIALMVPCGAHWIPQGPVLRAASGAVFAFGVFTFLWAPVRARMTGRSPNGSRGAPNHGVWVYTAGLGTTLALLPALGLLGGTPGAYLLAGWVACGALALGALVFLDLALAARGAFNSLLFRRSSSCRR